jgi:uncharacterized protein DUF4242
MAIFLCERTFATPMTSDQFAAGGKVLGPCLEARDVKHVESFLASDGKSSICVFEAADAERVREANRTAGMPFDRVVAVAVFKPQ